MANSLIAANEFHVSTALISIALKHSDTFNFTNNFLDPYLPIHHTTFMARRFVLIPFSLSILNARRS